MSSPSDTPVHVINYDAGGYDYRQFWNGRDYEQWAEQRVIRRALRRIPPVEWMVDLGGGYGRNVPLELERAQHVVLVDYSWTNLTNAEQTLLANPANVGRVFLIRGNLYHLPFRTAAFEIGATIRVLHHLSAIEEAITEQSRVLAAHWLMDVPIKHHLLARIKAMVRGGGQTLRSPDANQLGSSDEPFWNFHLSTIRAMVRHQGWSDTLLASMSNFRRWERVTPRPLRGVVRPVVYGADRVVQPLGRGWWGPAQFLWLSRQPATPFVPATVASAPPTPWETLALRMWCPACQGELAWSETVATCQTCKKEFTRQGMIWDFVVE